MKIEKETLKPFVKCLFCQKTLSETGGSRIVAQKTRAVYLSAKNIGGGDKDFPTRCIKLSEANKSFLVLRMPESEFSDEVMDRAKSQISAGLHPWFCQMCANRICSECGAPTQLVMGADQIDSNGKTGHQGIMPVNPGCINKKCKNHRKVE